MIHGNAERDLNALDDLWGRAARSLLRRPDGDAQVGPCERRGSRTDRERVLWDLIDGALDPEAERPEWDHVRECPACLTPVRRILAGIESAAREPRWDRARIEAFLVHTAEPAASPTEEALAALAGLRKTAPKALKATATDAWLLAADQLLAAGKKQAAAAVYKQVYEAQQEFLDKYRIVEYKVQPSYEWRYE